MNLFTKWIIENLDKVSLRLVGDVRTFFHRFFDDNVVLHAIQSHTSGWQPDNGMSERACQYLIAHKDELNNFNSDLANGLTKAIQPQPVEAPKASDVKEEGGNK